MTEWVKTAMRREVVRRAVRVSVVVGTLLVAINQGDAIIAGNLGGDAAWKIPLTFLVPYCVSTYASVTAVREAR